MWCNISILISRIVISDSVSMGRISVSLMIIMIILLICVGIIGNGGVFSKCLGLCCCYRMKFDMINLISIIVVIRLISWFIYLNSCFLCQVML